ncbi:hypothetical protein ABPG75_003223 [Micractinium tetrahymenae]
MAAPVPPLPSEEAWGDLLDGLPDVGLLDDMQVDCLLEDAVLPPGLDPLDGLDLGLDPVDAAALGAPSALGTGATASAGSHPSSDLLESLQLDATPFAELANSSGAGHSPNSSGSGSDSPVAMLGTGLAAHPPLAAAAQQLAEASPPPSRASPATSESENNGQPQRGRSPAGIHATTSGAAGVSAGAGASGAAAATAQHLQQQQQQQQLLPANRQHITEEEKRLARMQRNRENAQLSRQRKKQQMAELEARCATLTQHNAKLTAAVQRLTAENATLRQQLALICQQAGRNAAVAQKTVAAAAKPTAATAAAEAAKPATRAAAPAAAPAAAKPAATTTATSATAAAAAAVAARGLLQQWPLLPFGFLPKMALPVQQQAARPGAAKAATMQQRPAAAGAPVQAAGPAPATKPAPAAQAAPAGGRAAKRARTAAGASTAFLALFSLFMFAGPFTPVPTTSPPTLGDTGSIATIGAQRSLQALPDAALLPSSAAGLRRSGRGLQALPATPAADPGSGGGQLQRPQFGPLPQHPALPGAAAALSPAAGGRHLQQLLNSTLQALLLEPGNAALEAAALQRLQELGPVALLLDADAPGAPPGANPLAASAAFPSLAGQLFGSAGLEVPQMCQKVLEFDAASVPHAARSRRSLERYVLGATGFRGRSLASGAAAAAAALPAGGGDEARASQQAQRLRQPTLRISEDDGFDEEGGEVEGARPAGPAGSAVLPTDGSPEGPVLVSVLLPANASGGGNGSSGGGGGHKLAVIDKVFVVLLHPAERYTTYSCALPRPVVL